MIAGLVTFLITSVRLVGELLHWDAKYFGEQAGGGFALVGIVWLVPLVGFAIGRKLKGAGHGPSSVWLAFVVALLGLAAVMSGAFYVFKKVPVETLPNWMTYLSYGAPAVALLILLVWPRAFFALLLYGVLARGPVIGAQYLSIRQNWDTHYEKLDPKFGQVAPAEKEKKLLVSQVSFWIPFTILCGAAAAAVGALTKRRSGGIGH